MFEPNAEDLEVIVAIIIDKTKAIVVDKPLSIAEKTLALPQAGAGEITLTRKKSCIEIGYFEGGPVGRARGDDNYRCGFINGMPKIGESSTAEIDKLLDIIVHGANMAEQNALTRTARVSLRTNNNHKI